MDPLRTLFTGEYSTAGRPLYKDPAGGVYSEKTVTFQTPTGKWVNAPSVMRGGRIETDQGVLEDFYMNNGYMDPITGRSLDMFESVDDAVRAARRRSQGLGR